MKLLLTILISLQSIILTAQVPDNLLCLLLNNHTTQCSEVSISELKKIKGLTINKSLQAQFKIIYAEVQILHQSGKISDIFISKNGLFTNELKNYLQNKTFVGDAIMINNAKIEELNPDKFMKTREVEKKIFKVTDKALQTTK